MNVCIYVCVFARMCWCALAVVNCEGVEGGYGGSSLAFSTCPLAGTRARMGTYPLLAPLLLCLQMRQSQQRRTNTSLPPTQVRRSNPDGCAVVWWCGVGVLEVTASSL